MELMKCFLAFVFSSCLIRTVVESQSVSVEPQVTTYLGGEVTLRCQFIQGGSAADVTQVEWRKESFSEALAVFHSEFGKTYSKSLDGRVHFTSSSVDDASISIININETDEGKYTCKYTTFPGGSKEATTTLTVRVVESQFVSVEPQVTTYLGGETTLRCRFIQGGSAADVRQVEWRKDSLSEPLAVFHSEFSKTYSKSLDGRVRFTSSSVDDASISIININETDEGKYTCKYTTFPGGIKEATTTLTVRDKPWERSTAVASGIVTALLLIVLIAAALYFIVMKRRQRCDAAPQSRSSRSRSSSRRATRITGREEEGVTYADVSGFRPAQGGSAILTSREGTEYAEVKRSVEGCGDVTYAQVNKR